MKTAIPILMAIGALSSVTAAQLDLAANATNELGLDLHRRLATSDANLCLSPYSIQTALAMTFAGADDETRTEMARVLHFPDEGEAIHVSFQALAGGLADSTKKSEEIAQGAKANGGPAEPIRLTMANRLFGQSGYEFRDVFKELVQRFYAAPIELLDFRHNTEEARVHINKWVADQTLDRIQDLIPPNGITVDTRLVLANAIYLKAPWQSAFTEGLTKPHPFHVHGAAAFEVPTMKLRAHLGYAKRDGYTAVTLPYIGGDLQFVILLPDRPDGLKDMETHLKASDLKQCAQMEVKDVDLLLPKFKLQPPTLSLKNELMALGMKTAFDVPAGSADFGRMAPRKPNSYLAISNIFHKTFISVDEHGTEAAAATAAAMMTVSAMQKPKEPIRVVVDRPFFYAIQHGPSGACLFMGSVTDPR